MKRRALGPVEIPSTSIVKTDPAAPYGSMVDALDELRLGEPRHGLGAIQVAISTEREMALYWPADL